MYYYEVAIGAEKHWDSPFFTYSHTSEMVPGDLVNVPFGRKNKVGVVRKAVKKPTFAAKPLTPYEGLAISQSTQDFIDWYQQYYAAQGGQAYTQLLPGYLTKKVPPLKNVEEPASQIEEPKLSTDQRLAKQQIQEQKPQILISSYILININLGGT